MLHRARGDHDTAIRLLEKALAVARRQYHRAYMGALAETYALMGDQDNALAWYRKTLESEKHSSPYMINFIIVSACCEKKDFRAASEAYQRFLHFWKDADPDLAILVDAKERLGALEARRLLNPLDALPSLATLTRCLDLRRRTRMLRTSTSS